MARLTEEMVMARSRGADIQNVKKLNCWGSELADVSLLRRMRSVEVLALSLNKIATLEDFQFCPNLTELFVRNNSIRDLNQILYLRDLPRLRVLWLDENPCATGELYRLTVLRALPHLQKLDNVVVQKEEIQDALRKGRDLVHPEEQLVDGMEKGMESAHASEPTARVQKPNVRAMSISEHETHYDHIEDEQFEDTDRRNANCEQDNRSRSSVVYSRNNAPYSSSYERSVSCPTNLGEVSSSTGSRDDQDSSYKDISPSSDEPSRRNFPASFSHEFRPSDSERSRLEEEETVTPRVMDRMVYQSRELTTRLARRPVTRNSNILSAALCLIKELDYPSLEVLEMAVRSRMDEM